jgi:hypothetical protein
MKSDDGEEFIAPPTFDPSELGGPSYERPPDRPRRDFRPWHAPRKQYVRKYQWATILGDIIGPRSRAEGIAYLGLPGIDLLDLRYFHRRICEPLKLPIRFVGFDHSASGGSQDSVELNISLQEVKLSPLVDPRSVIHPGDLRDLTSEKSQGFQLAKDAAPFDVVNIDLCDNFLFDDPSSDRSIYAALSNIFSLQDKSQQPWGLYLTSSLNRDAVHDGVFELLAPALSKALEDCPDFAELCSPLLGAGALEEFDWSTSEGPIFYSWSILAVCVWIYALARRRHPNGVNLKASFGYNVHGGSALDMFSIAFKITPKFGSAVDPSGLATHSSGTDDSPCPSYSQFSNRVQGMKDVDSILDVDEELMNELVSEAADLLVEARYDRDLYIGWVKETAKRED